MSRTFNTLPLNIRVKKEAHYYWVHSHFNIGRISYQKTWFLNENYEYEITSRVVTRVYEDHCTCGVSNNTANIVKENGKIDPCYKEIYKKGRESYAAQEVKINWAGGRERTKTRLKETLKKFNSNQNINDEDVSEYVYHSKPPKVWIY